MITTGSGLGRRAAALAATMLLALGVGAGIAIGAGRGVDIVGAVALVGSGAIGAAGCLEYAERTRAPRRPPPEEEAESGFARYRFHRERVRAGTASAERYAVAVAPTLRSLADDRLHRRLGIDRAKDPDAARAACSDALWDVLVATPGPPPSPGEIAALLEEIGRW